MMIKIRTRPINTRPASSMRAALNSRYCMRAQISSRSLANGKDTCEVAGWNGMEAMTPRRWREKFFSYQEGQHRVRPNGQREKTNGNGKLRLPEEVRITKTANGKRWISSSMEVELAKDILEVRDGLGKVVDALILEKQP